MDHYFQVSGTGEDGLLKFWCESTIRFPRATAVHDGPFRAILALRHPQIVGILAKTDGNFPFATVVVISLYLPCSGNGEDGGSECS